MTIALVASTTCAPSFSGGSTSSPGITTTGATLLVMVTSKYTNGTPTPTDSFSNTWTNLTDFNSANLSSEIWYVANPTVGSSHTFSWGNGASLTYSAVMAFSGVVTSSPFDQQSGANFAQSPGQVTAQPGSLTPTNAGSLFISGVTANPINSDAETCSIDSSFSIITPQAAFSTSSWSSAGAYLIQSGGPTAINPTWTYPSTGGDYYGLSTSMAVFKPSGGGGGGGPLNNSGTSIFVI